MGMLDRREVARVLREIGAILQIKGENPFKTRAYEVAALRLEDLPPERFEELVAQGRLQELQGIGEAIAKKVTTLCETGKLALYEELRAEFPPGLLELMRVPELGPRKIAALYRELKIASLDELAQACRAGRIRELRGFGERTEAKLLEGIASIRQADPRRPLAEVRPVALELAARLRSAPGVVHAEVAGSVRRFREMVNDIDLVVAAPDAAPVFDWIASAPGVARVLARGDTKCSVLTRENLQVDVRVLPPAAWATALHHFTGSKPHHIRLRALAQARGLKISEWAVERAGAPLPISSEEDLYRALGMPFIPPELREDTGEVEAALEGRLPELVTPSQVRGLVHVHTRYSDGADSIRDMALAAKALGAAYLAITDHSRSAGYAGGLSLEQLEQQWGEMAELQRELPDLVLLKGAEVDILEDGSLDYPKEVLARLDVVVGSVHSRFKMTEQQMTERILKAMDNPYLHLLGHPTGRLLGQRAPYPVRMEEVLQRAADRGVAIEVNGNPSRLDLSAEHVRLALERGVKLMLTSDAHSTSCLAHLEYAVATARKGWARREDVLNTFDAEAFGVALRSMRR
jgi:DNA polymerase (family 10)